MEDPPKLKETLSLSSQTRVPGSRRAKDWDIDVAAMAGSLVHEIKNPLSTLNINAQLLLEDWKDPVTPREQRAVKRLSVMVAEVERLERILQTFLRFTEHHELALQCADLNKLLEELVDFVSPQADKLGIQIRVGLDPGLGPFLFDADLIRQVFLNLIQNAQQAMTGKGGELIIRTRRELSSGGLSAVGEVIDTGPGIGPRGLEKLFELYYSTKQGGSGLGLAISKRIVEEHGGHIEVRTELGKGSQFAVHLPIEPGEEGRS
jgi:two-component system sensor histidine kinase HydH